ncbi:MAG: threonine aldolase family protein [Bacillota bacterium]
MENKLIDLRSDTVTRPSNEMRQIMAGAEVGDDVYEEDPSINELEARAADIMGKEAALFFPSGTMANQAAVITHTRPGQEIILGEQCHIFYYEVGGLARLGGLQAKTVSDEGGYLDALQVEQAIRGKNIHYPETGLICMENTHNRHGGLAYGREEITPIVKIAEAHNIPTHLDGARIFNAAIAEGISAADLIAGIDSVMFCLSKGLGAPVGSILVGTREFITRARKTRKMLGGGMRQAGILASAGLYGLENRGRLKEDHHLAEKLADGIEALNSEKVEVISRATNFVMLNWLLEGGAAEMVRRFKEKDIITSTFSDNVMRLVVHQDVSEADIDYFLTAAAESLEH